MELGIVIGKLIDLYWCTGPALDPVCKKAKFATELGIVTRKLLILNYISAQVRHWILSELFNKGWYCHNVSINFYWCRCGIGSCLKSNQFCNVAWDCHRKAIRFVLVHRYDYGSCL